MRIAAGASRHRGVPPSTLRAAGRCAWSVDGRGASCWHQPVLRFEFFILLVAVSCLYAAIRGGAPERITALLLLTAFILSLLLRSPHGSYTHVEVGIFLVDVGLFAALYLLSILSTRFWPIWMSGMQGVEVLAHCAILAPPVTPFAYAVMIDFWGYPMSVLLIVATRRHRLRLGRRGTDDPWVFSSARSGRPIPN